MYTVQYKKNNNQPSRICLAKSECDKNSVRCQNERQGEPDDVGTTYRVRGRSMQTVRLVLERRCAARRVASRFSAVVVVFGNVRVYGVVVVVVSARRSGFGQVHFCQKKKKQTYLTRALNSDPGEIRPTVVGAISDQCTRSCASSEELAGQQKRVPESRHHPSLYRIPRFSKM